jgi:1-deoxy-D-xylulose-5-phosphate reductoisomerase
MKKLISILGSTGSVGLTTLSIIDKTKNEFYPYIFSANKNFNLICKQIKKYKPKIFVISDKNTFLKTLSKYKYKKIKILNNFDSLKIKTISDITISAIPGIAGLKPTIKMTGLSSKILLANKESIICGWNLILKKSKKNKTKLIPIDSEHFSILKLLENQKRSQIKKIYLTASGGPFLNFTSQQLKKIKPKQALRHPKWKMGRKITIDSATLMNKIFELIEAQKLFNISNNLMDIIIHPNSLVHAIIELKNGLKKIVYHETSMIIPLANGIFDGEVDIKRFYKKKVSFKFENLIFKKVDKNIFPAINLISKMNQFPSAPIIINAANEVLVDQFLNKKIPFLDINKIIMAIIKDSNYKKYAVKNPSNIKQIYQIDFWARRITINKINKKKCLKNFH